VPPITVPDIAERVIEGSPDGVLVVSATGRIVLANRQFADMVGLPTGDVVGAGVEQFVPDAARSRHAELRAGFHGSRPMGAGIALSLQTAQGVLVPVEIALADLQLDGSSMVVATVRDVTERREAEAEMRAAAELLMIADERERIARDLHDTVLQRLFGLGLELQAFAMRSGEQPQIERAVDEIDRIIREIRTAVFTLGGSHGERSLASALGVVVSQAARLLGFSPRLRLSGPVSAATPVEVQSEVVATLREALSNVARHAEASEVHVEISVGDELTMRVIDNGRGFDGTTAGGGMGLRTMADRARGLGGSFSIDAAAGQGTTVVWSVPLHDVRPA
jgi:PAS domain S-box-containing protein